MKKILMILAAVFAMSSAAFAGDRDGRVSLGFSRQEHWSVLPFPSPMHEGEK